MTSFEHSNDTMENFILRLEWLISVIQNNRRSTLFLEETVSLLKKMLTDSTLMNIGQSLSDFCWNWKVINASQNPQSYDTLARDMAISFVYRRYCERFRS